MVKTMANLVILWAWFLSSCLNESVAQFVMVAKLGSWHINFVSVTVHTSLIPRISTRG